MNTGGHIMAGGEHVHDEQNDRNRALTDLRRRLAGGMTRARLNQSELAGLAGLGRTTVSEALSAKKPVPSAQTVEELARVLKLPVQELLELQRTATEAAGTVPTGGPGRPIGQWEPHDLEVHPAGPGSVASGADAPAVRALPGYVSREHDRVLADVVEDAAAGRSRIVFLVGRSSTGKTRACWEAVQPLADRGWRLWHPFDPTRAQAALEDLNRVGPRTVVWLNEARHYLGDRAAGERVAAAVHQLLVSPERGPVLVLGTLWPDYARSYTVLPESGAEDPHSRVRELLSGRTVDVPDAFDAHALAAAEVLAEGGDRLLGDALTRAGTNGRVTQDLAGAPELLNRYQHASPAAKALLEAAMDARRLGVGPHLPHAFLTDAAPDYLSQTDYDELTEDWAEAAFAELARPVHGKQTPLGRTTPRPPRRPLSPVAAAGPAAAPPVGPQFRLADYLEQHGRDVRRRLCPPASFWHAAHTRLTDRDDLSNLARAAEARYRLQWAHHLLHRAADHGDTDVLYRLAMVRERAGDREGAEVLFRQAAGHDDTDALYQLAVKREEAGDRGGAETLAWQAVAHGNTRALFRLAEMREEAGGREGALALLRQAADQGDSGALLRLATLREEAGDREGAEVLLRRAAGHGSTDALLRLATLREEAGDREGAAALALQAAAHGNTNDLVRLVVQYANVGDWERAEILAWQAVAHGNTRALFWLAEMREEAGGREGALALLRQAADHGDADALLRLATLREGAGDREGVETLAWQAVAQGRTGVLIRLAEMREGAGDREGAETLAYKAADHGHTDALLRLATLREEAEDWEDAEVLTRQAADRGDPYALLRLALRREIAGDREDAEALARQAADRGDPYALYRLAEMREEAGDREDAEALARQAADCGDPYALHLLAEMRDTGLADLADCDQRRETYLQYLINMRWLFSRLWPNGLDPDGAPTPLRQPSAPTGSHLPPAPS
ncbi:helix-turn-helix domain-containing protein [Streptomyces sp. NBC_01725]|uniref:helix-turn-helix domain-containing protein n=1 Tax=Streptomyces sp. NBC_01725 TaxID=2975923 RepID=UPI002E2DAE60|nr:helix-turn-helix domain-containing protein [Streptomyces sp. NBC_01725]